jgi:hypothetical protein
MAPQAPWKWTPAKIEEMAASLLEFMEDPERTFFKGWCVRQGIPSSHLSRFAEMSPAFAEALERASDIQELRLLQGGTNGTLHHAITKLVLCSKHNYTDRSDLAVTPAPAKPILGTVEDCDKLIQQATEQKQMLQGIVTAARLVESAVVG